MKHRRGEGSRMALRMGGKRTGSLALLCAAALTVLAAPATSAADPPPCRVRNVTQDTAGRSHIRMVERADDGDRLRVKGTCRGPVTIDTDLTIYGANQDARLTGRDESRVVRIARGSVVTIREVTILRGDPSHGFGGGGVKNLGDLTIVDSTIERSLSGDQMTTRPARSLPSARSPRAPVTPRFHQGWLVPAASGARRAR